MKNQYEHLDKLLEGSGPVGNGNLYDELLGEGATGYDDLLGSEVSDGGVVENSIYHSVDNIIKEAMRKDLSSEIMLREDFDPEEKLEKLDRLNSVTITNEHVMTYINDYIDPILEGSNIEYLEDGDVFPIHPLFMEMIGALYDYEGAGIYESEVQKQSLEESILGDDLYGRTIEGDRAALKEELEDIYENYDIYDIDNRKELMGCAIQIKENVHPSWFSTSIVGLVESEYDVDDEDHLVEHIVANYSYSTIIEEADDKKKGLRLGTRFRAAKRSIKRGAKNLGDKASETAQKVKDAPGNLKHDAEFKYRGAKKRAENTKNKAKKRVEGMSTGKKIGAGAAGGAAAAGLAAGAVYGIKKLRDRRKRKKEQQANESYYYEELSEGRPFWDKYTKGPDNASGMSNKAFDDEVASRRAKSNASRNNTRAASTKESPEVQNLKKNQKSATGKPKKKLSGKKIGAGAAGAAALGAAGAYAYKKYKDKKKKKAATNEAVAFLESHLLCCFDEEIIEQITDLANHWDSML